MVIGSSRQGRNELGPFLRKFQREGPTLDTYNLKQKYV